MSDTEQSTTPGTSDSSAADGARVGMFTALHVRNYRIYFIGQLISMCGTWMQGTAMAAYILYRLDGSGKDLGLLSTFTFLPVIAIGLWAGVVIDRFPKRTILVWVQITMGTIATIQTVLIATGTARLWMIYALTFLNGFANTFDQPARQTFANELVPRPILTNAVGLSSMLFHTGRVVGQALGGVLVTVIGYSWCFGINAASYLAILVGFVMMRTDELHPSPVTPRSKGQVREGIAYVRSTPVIQAVVLVVFALSTFSLNFQVVVPLLAKEVFHGGPRTIGWFQAAVGIGSVAASLRMARRNRPVPRHLADTTLLFAVVLVGVALSPTPAITMIALALCGLSFMTFFMTANTTLQLTADPSMRGRVMALYAFTFSATTPLGALVIGFLSDRIGPRGAVLFTASWAFVVAAGAYRAAARGLLPAELPSESTPA